MRVVDFIEPIVRSALPRPIGAGMIPPLGIGPSRALGKFLGRHSRAIDLRQIATGSCPQHSGAREMNTPSDTSASKSREIKAFLFFTVVAAPAFAGIVVGVYGLVVW